ncbi:MAG: hypothetical protein HC765_10690 [Brachymonas sp.]|nr:hypothetical protein [Brachymonas sp.]
MIIHIKMHIFQDLRAFFRLMSSVFSALILVSGCANIPTSGPSSEEIAKAVKLDVSPLQVVDVTDSVARQLLTSRRKNGSFVDSFVSREPSLALVGAGDVLEITIGRHHQPHYLAVAIQQRLPMTPHLAARLPTSCCEIFGLAHCALEN